MSEWTIWSHPKEDARLVWNDRKTVRFEVPLGDSHVDMSFSEAERMARKILNNPWRPQ